MFPPLKNHQLEANNGTGLWEVEDLSSVSGGTYAAGSLACELKAVPPPEARPPQRIQSASECMTRARDP